MGKEGFEPPATWPPANLINLAERQIMYHTKLDHFPVPILGTEGIC